MPLYNAQFITMTGMVVMIIWEIIHGKKSLNLVLLLVLPLNFVISSTLELMYLSSQISGQALLISMVLTACGTAIAHRNHFFFVNRENKIFASKVKFREASNKCKRALEPAIAMVIKQKSLSLSTKKTHMTFGKLLIVFSTKVNLLYLLYLMDQGFSSASDKAKVLAKNVSKNANLDDPGISLPAFLSRTCFSFQDLSERKNMAPFCEWSSTASRLVPLRGDSLLFTTKFPTA